MRRAKTTPKKRAPARAFGTNVCISCNAKLKSPRETVKHYLKTKHTRFMFLAEKR